MQNSFELGSLPWTDQLAVHEFRHVQQYNNFDVGLSHVLRVLFGDGGQALANNGAIPNWFFEGDAVYNETNVTKQGRGRLPYFFDPYRSLWLAGKNYSWMKLRNGSYKDYTPDHYALGYLLVAYGREKYGDDFWKNVTHDAAAFKGLFYPFQKAIKKYSGRDYTQFRNDALGYFKNYFNQNSPQRISQETGSYKNEAFPALEKDNSLIYVRSTYDHVPVFIIKKGNIEKKIRIKDVSIDDQFSYRNGKIVYAFYRSDIRWGYRDYSDIQILDAASGEQKTLTRHSKYFSPDISEDGKSIVAVQVSPDQRSALHILNSTDGNIISVVPNPEGLFYTYPKFYHNKIMAAVRNKKGMMSLGIFDIATGAADYLAPFSYNVIGFPTELRDTIYFTASNKNDDNLFAYDMRSREFFSLHFPDENDLGYYQPAVGDDAIAWSTFTAEGSRIHYANKGSVKWTNIPAEILNAPPSGVGITSLDKTNANLLASVPDEHPAVTRYHKSFGLLNFHSLEPDVNDPDYTLTLISENILNTLQTGLSFDYNRSEQFKKIGINTIYGALFPYLSAGVDYTIDRRGLYNNKLIFWNEIEPGIGINFPLNLSKGRSFTNLNFGTRYTYNSSAFKGAYKDSFGTVSFSYINNFFTLIHQSQKAQQNIFPRFAQSIALDYKTALTNYKGSQFEVEGNLYLPGFLVNHNIVLNVSYLYKDTAHQLNFSSSFPFSRGYTAVNLHEMVKWGVNYHLPLLYPDAGVGNIVYFLRVRANLFYDDTHTKDFFSNRSIFSGDFRSTGAELFFDTKWWNESPVTFGIRYSYLLDNDLFGNTGKNRVELILPVNIFTNK